MNKFISYAASILTLCLLAMTSMMAQVSQSPIQSVTPFDVQINGSTIDVSKYGYFHNILLTYTRQHTTTPSQRRSKCESVDLTNTQYNSGVSTNSPAISTYYKPMNWNCNQYNASFPDFYPDGSNISTTTVANIFSTNLTNALNIGLINAGEKAIIEELYTKLINGQTINYSQLKSNWISIQGKPNGGALSALMIVIAAHSETWWGDPTNGGQAMGGPIADLVHGFWGCAQYAYNNWDDHYLSEFGLNMLEAGGHAAVEGSTFHYLFKKFGF